MEQTGEAGNVFDLLRYKKPMKNPILMDVLAYWERLRGDRLAPMRSEIDPREIEDALANAFILERTEKDQARFRIAGMHLSELMGMEVRGMPASTLIAPQSRERFHTILNNVFKAPEIVELHLSAARPGVTTLSAQMLLLPMQSDQGQMSRILGCLVADHTVGTLPLRFELTGQKVTRIVASGFEPARQSATGFAEPVRHYEPKPQDMPANAKTAPYLRLVSTAD